MRQTLDYIVFLRLVATLAVVLNHTALVAYDSNSIVDGIIVQSIVHIVHFAVPIFVMITGALLLDKSRTINYRIVIGKYVWRMVVIILVIGSLFALMQEAFLVKTINPMVLYRTLIDVLTAQTWDHMWYLYMLIGLYLVLPFLKAALYSMDKKNIDCFIVIMFLFSSVLPMLSKYLNLQLGIQCPIDSEYLLYLILGWRISIIDIEKQELKKINRVLLLIIISVSIIICLMPYFEFVYNLDGLKHLIAYNSPIEVILGASIFWCSIINYDIFDGLSKNKYVSICNKNSFGIYIFHMLWINVLYKILHITPISVGWWSFILFCGVIIALSVITTEIYRRIPIIGKYV